MKLEPPITLRHLVEDLRRLGLEPGDTVFVHCSLRALAGPRSMVVGGAVAVVEALQETLTPEGTLVFPAFSADVSDPALWTSPPVPETWWPTIRELMPPFRIDRTPTFRIGVVPEVFRAMDEVHRSDHPQSSFTAWGAHARGITRGHPLPRALGDRGPLGRLHDLDAKVLMLGSPWGNCTCFHLAEDRMREPPRTITQGAPLMRDGMRQWVSWGDLDYRSDDFGPLGELWEREGGVRVGQVGRATSRLFPIRPAVEFALRWLEANR